MIHAGGYSILNYVVHIPFAYLTEEKYASWHLYSAAVFPFLVNLALWWRRPWSLVFLRASFVLEAVKYFVLILMILMGSFLGYSSSSSEKFHPMASADFILEIAMIGIVIALHSEKAGQLFRLSRKIPVWLLLVCVVLIGASVTKLPAEEYKNRVAGLGRPSGAQQEKPYMERAFSLYGADNIAYNNDGKIFAKSQRNEVTLYYKDTRTLVHSGKMEAKGNPNALTFSPDGRFLLAATSTSKKASSYPGFDMWQVETGERVDRFVLPEGVLKHEEAWGAVYDLQFSPDGRYLAVGQKCFWDFQTGKLVYTSEKDYFRGTWADAKTYLAVGRDSREVIRISVEARTEEPLLSFDQSGRLIAMCVSQDGLRAMFFIETKPKCVIEIWDIKTAKTIHSWNFDSRNNKVRFSSNGKYLAIDSNRQGEKPYNTIELWDAECGVKVKLLVHPGDGSYKKFAYSGDNKNLAILSGDIIAFYVLE